LNHEEPSSQQIIEYLYREGIQSLLIEGGAEVLSHFISNRLWDEAEFFKGLCILKNGVRAPAIKGSLISTTSFQEVP